MIRTEQGEIDMKGTGRDLLCDVLIVLYAAKENLGDAVFAEIMKNARKIESGETKGEYEEWLKENGGEEESTD